MGPVLEGLLCANKLFLVPWLLMTGPHVTQADSGGHKLPGNASPLFLFKSQIGICYIYETQSNIQAFLIIIFFSVFENAESRSP